MAYNEKNTMGKKIMVFFLLLLPAILAFFMLKWTHDAILTMLSLIALYGLTIFIYKSVIEEWNIEFKLAKDNILSARNKIVGIQTFAIFGLALGIFAILWTLFIPWGIKVLKLPFPKFSGNFWIWLYYLLFIIIWFVYLACEHNFFNFFGYIEMNEEFNKENYEDEPFGFCATIFVCVAYGLLNFVVMIYCVGGFGAALTIVALAMIMNFVLIKTRLVNGIMISTFSRLAFGLGLLLWFIYLSRSPEWWRRKSPELYQGYMPDNVFNKQ